MTPPLLGGRRCFSGGGGSVPLLPKDGGVVDLSIV